MTLLDRKKAERLFRDVCPDMIWYAHRLSDAMCTNILQNDALLKRLSK